MAEDKWLQGVSNTDKESKPGIGHVASFADAEPASEELIAKLSKG